MASIGDLPDDMAELQVLLAEESLAENNPARLPYLLPNWWNHPSAKVYRAHIDLKRFYPSIRLEVILENLAAYHPSLPIEFSTLLRQLLTFPLAFDGYAKTELKDLGLSPETPLYLGVPTGLFVAGFLANVGMLSIDRQVQSQIRQMQVAHFRYVDDHTFLAPTLDALLSWMDFYRELLRSKAIGVQINDRKTEPRSLQSLYKRVIRQRPDLRAGTISLSRSERARLEKDAVIDPQYPNPLMTATLAKISDVAHTPFALLDERSQDHLLQELEFLLTARLPDDEIRDDTRISFAASRLAQLAAHHVPPVPQSNDNFRPIRILHLITRAIRGYPEKLRLWLHALQFARSSGLADLTVISEELDLLAR